MIDQQQATLEDGKEEFSRLIERESSDGNHERTKFLSTKSFVRLFLLGQLAAIILNIISRNTTKNYHKEAFVQIHETPVVCKKVHMPNLSSTLYSYSRICYPDDGIKHPLHFFAHGDFGGGPFAFAYRGIVQDIAREGFVVSMYLSCPVDILCDGGKASFLEILKSMVFLESNDGWWKDVIDFDVGYSASGHSTGGRAVLMLAALIDNPDYLSGTKYAIPKTALSSVRKIQAVVADHPDPMYDETYNPDPSNNFVVNQTPVMIVTGTDDRIEPESSAWKNFEAIKSPNRVFVDLLGEGHLGPLIHHSEGPYIAYFSQCFIEPISLSLKSCERIYDQDSPESMRNALQIARAGDRNTETIGFVGCWEGEPVSESCVT